MWTENRPGSTCFVQNKVSDSDCPYIFSKQCRALCVSARKEYDKIGIYIYKFMYNGLAGIGITDKDLIMQLDRSKEVMVKQVESVFCFLKLISSAI